MRTLTRLVSVGCGFAGGFFTLAALLDGANGWVPSHVGIALASTAAAVLIAAVDD